MATPVFKCIHAADLHLEQVCTGFDQIPIDFLDPLIDAPYLAAESIFTAALNEEVDAVLLTGDVLSSGEYGPRSLMFLVEQTERLAARGISVYWALGGSDPPLRWPSAALFPETVHRLVGKYREVFHPLKNGQQLRLLGPADQKSTVRSSDYPTAADAQISIALGYGTASQQALAKLDYHYWALGGVHLRETFSRNPTMHYAGTPQGRSPAESGPRGCTLVEIDSEGLVQTSPIVTDAVRWNTFSLSLDPDTSQESLYGMIQSQIARGIVDAASRPLLATWNIAGSGSLVRSLQKADAKKKLLEDLNAVDYGGASVWHVAVEAQPAEYPAAWYEEETILGEFLRSLRQLQNEGIDSSDWEKYLPCGNLGAQVAARLKSEQNSDSSLAIKRAADLGVHLLSGEDV
ncbi:MAG: hypothetical protein CMJ74_06395 [Planctomycetaceae bacterium]|nr:hypothetical protein [Planctomycetaceae bacterium]|tara:strand:- start:240 stop:1451 length:1212 start_codon:yes stop_codon:yes gene_type:complete